MATTGNLIHELVVGIRTTADAVAASGLARFYAPGTLTPATVYSDTACTAAITQPLTLNAAGQYRYAYSLAPLRMIVKDSTDVTTYIDANVNIVRSAQVFITNTAVNGGVETPLDDYFTGLVDDDGAAYLESATATTRGVNDWLRADSVQAADFNAAGDGTTDDTTFLQAGLDHCAATGKVFHIPAGTYKITAPLTLTSGLCAIVGDGPKLTVIKNFGTTTAGLVLNFASPTDAPFMVRGLTVTANTTSTAAAVSNTNANNSRYINVETALHRKGIYCGGATGCVVTNCTVLSTDGNSAGVGVDLGADGRAFNTRATAATGTGFTGGVLYGCTVPGSTATGFTAFTLADGCTVSGTTTTAFSLAALGRVNNCLASGSCTTAISSGATAFVSNTVITGGCTNAILFTAGNALIQNVHFSGTATGTAFSLAGGTATNLWTSTGHNIGISTSGADAVVSNCSLAGSTVTGISVTGARSRVIGCTVSAAVTGISATGANSSVVASNVTGACTTGITAGGANVRVVNCAVTGACTTGVNLSTAGASSHGCTVTASTTGIALGAADTKAFNNYVDAATTGFSVAAVADCVVTGNTGAANTSDLTVNASATGLVMHSNAFSAVTDGANTAATWDQSQRKNYKTGPSTTVSGTASPTFTPSVANGTYLNIHYNSGGAGTVTIAATSSTGVQANDVMEIMIATVNAKTLAWDGTYLTFQGTGGALPSSLSASSARWFKFIREPVTADGWWRLLAVSAEMPLV